MAKKRRLRKEVKLIGFALLLLIMIIFMAFALINSSPLKLIAKETEVSYKEEIDYLSYIKENKKLNLDEVIIHNEEVNTEKLGTYKVTYEYKNKKQELEITIKDTVAPVIQENDLTLIKDSDMNLKDKIYITDDYSKNLTVNIDESKLDRSKVGTYEILVEAKDESDNTSSATLKVKVLEANSEDLKVIYLTFDDGPSPVTAKVLDVLKKYNVKATFFVCGANGASGVVKYGDLTKRAYEEGHTIAIHSYTHDYKKIYKNNDAFMADLTKLSNAVEKITGEKPKYMRFPGGTTNGYCKDIHSLIDLVHSKGYEYFDWNVSSGDAAKPTVKASKIIKNCTKESNLKYKKINLLMHDLITKTTAAEALPAIIEFYQKHGYEFRAIDDNAYLAQFK